MFGIGGKAAPLLTIVLLDGGEWLLSRTGRFTPGEGTSSTHREEAGLDSLERRGCRYTD